MCVITFHLLTLRVYSQPMIRDMQSQDTNQQI